MTGRDEHAARIDQLVSELIKRIRTALASTGRDRWKWRIGACRGCGRSTSTRQDRPLPDATRERMARELHDHGRFFCSVTWSFTESPFNHLIGESSVLYVLESDVS